MRGVWELDVQGGWGFGGGGVQGSESWCSIRLDVNVLCEGAVHLTAIKTVTKPRNTLPSPVS